MTDLRNIAALKFIAELSVAELACRLAETIMDGERPDGMSPEQAMDSMAQEGREIFVAAAKIAIEYFAECIRNAQRPS